MSDTRELRVAVVGYGRMGHAVEARAEARGHRVVTTLDAGGGGLLSSGEVDVAIEFSVAGAVEGNLLSLVGAGIPVVSGTTGNDAGVDRGRLLAKERGVPFIWAPNFALGVHVTSRLVRLASRWLGRMGEFEPYVEERHHSAKADAPSGTARRFADIVVEETPGKERFAAVPGSGRLDGATVAVGAVRAGHQPGAHTIGWDAPLEEIRLSHQARDRSVFAEGAVRAAEWIVGEDGPRTIDELIDAMIS